MKQETGMDTPEFRRLLFIAQQRRARYVALDILIPTEDNEEEWNESIGRADQARDALFESMAALLDYLQKEIRP